MKKFVDARGFFALGAALLLLPLCGAELLKDPAFSQKANNRNSPWAYWGKYPKTLAFSGNTAKLAGGILMQKGLPLAPAKWYKLSFALRGEAGAMARGYVEWKVRRQNGKEEFGGTCSTGWIAAAPEWRNCSVMVKVTPDTISSYLVLGVKDQRAAEFRDVKLEEAPTFSDLGGTWELGKHSYDKEGLLLLGMQKDAKLCDIPVTPGKKYEIRYDAQVQERKVLSDDGGFFRLRSRVTPGVKGSNGVADILHGKGNAVQQRSHVFSVPANAKSRRVTFSVRALNPGRVRLNHFQLREVPVKASDFWSMRLQRPFYRDAFYPGDDAAKITGEAQTAGADHLRITFNGKVTEFPVTGKVTAFTVPFGLPAGKYAFRCDFLVNGKVEKSFTKTIARYPKAPNVVTVSPERKLLFNGRPFFPVYMKMRSSISEGALYFAARNGVNATGFEINPADKMLKELDLAHKYGMKLFLHLCAPGDFRGLVWFRKRIREWLTPAVITHPALLGYGLPDEPALQGLPAALLQEEYRLLREHDPYHPCWINLAPRNEVEDLIPYGEACDILSVDIYPIPYPNGHSGLEDKTPTCCGKYALRVNEIGREKKAVFSWLQGFAWHECSGPGAAVKPYPTRTESRFMAYDNLLNGGIGYWLWGVQHVRSKVFQQLLYRMTRELHNYSGLFSGGKQLADLKTSDPSVRCAVMEYCGKKYYFLMNLTAKFRQAQAAVSGKVLDSDGGSFADGKVTLSPYEVVVVSESPLPAPQYALPAENKALERSGDPAVRDIDEQERIRRIPFYRGSAAWIWYADGQTGLARCFAGKRFSVRAGEKVVLNVTADDAFIAYLNGKEVLRNEGWSQMLSRDVTKLVRTGENQLVILGVDKGGAPCGILAELRVGEKVFPTDASWKVRSAYKGDPVPKSMDKDSGAVIVTPYGGGAWGGQVRVFDR